jgi:membrane protease subunit HflC
MLACAALYAAFFTVDVTHYGVVSRFGRIVRVVEVPGLHMKLPFDRVLPVDRRLLYSTPDEAEYLTSDKKNVVMQSLALWRIADPERFIATVRTRAEAEVELTHALLAETGAVVGTYPFASFVSPAIDGRRFAMLVAEVGAALRAYARPAFGIDIVDVEVRRLSMPEANKRSVFERMKAERGRIAKAFRSEGERDADRMIAEAEREKARIAAEAYEEATRLRAEGDAEATSIYAEAFARDPSFYKFRRTLQAYESFLDNQTTLFLPADAELLSVLHGLAPDDGAPAHGPGSPGPGEGRSPPLAEALVGGAASPKATPVEPTR